MILYLPNAFAMFAAGAVSTPTPASAVNTPVSTTKSPMRKREFRKADREADFLFMRGYDGGKGIRAPNVAHTQNARSVSRLFAFLGALYLLYV